jgi:serine/threonine protein phosphatase PrpC
MRARTAQRLFIGEHMDAPVIGYLNQGEVAVFSARSPDKETVNEDAAALIDLGGGNAILAVADGAGGMAAGHEASSIAMHTLAATFGPAEDEGSGTRDAVLNAIESAARQIAELGIGAATTFAAVELSDATARPYHVGDSMILSTGQRGRLKLQTVSHSPVGYAVESGLLDATEAMHHEERHIVSNMVGTPDMRIEIGAAMRLEPRDTLVLATDGLFDNLHVWEIVELVRKGPLRLAADRLAQACRGRMLHPAHEQPSKPDDLTFILYRRTATGGGRRRPPG